MSAATELRLPFLGRRDYLHGTTLYDALAPRCARGSNLSFRVNRLIESDRVAVSAFDVERDEAGRYSASLIWEEGGAQQAVAVTALAPSPAPERLAFDEDAIVRSARFEGAMVTTRMAAGTSLIRHLVPLNKALLHRVLVHSDPGQWLFTRLDLDRWSDGFDELRLTWRPSTGRAAASTSVAIDGRDAGRLIFSWLPK